jgi:hypothetical protein
MVCGEKKLAGRNQSMKILLNRCFAEELVVGKQEWLSKEHLFPLTTRIP